MQSSDSENQGRRAYLPDRFGHISGIGFHSVVSQIMDQTIVRWAHLFEPPRAGRIRGEPIRRPSEEDVWRKRDRDPGPLRPREGVVDLEGGERGGLRHEDADWAEVCEVGRG